MNIIYRSTKRSAAGRWELKGLSWERFAELDLTDDERMSLYGALTRLKDYEESGLSPGLVNEFSYLITDCIRQGFKGPE